MSARKVGHMSERSDSVWSRAQTIMEYAESVGIDHPLAQNDYTQSDLESLDSLAESCERYLRFGRLVDATISGRQPKGRHILVLPSTPDLLLSIGVPDLPWIMTQGHLNKALLQKGPKGGHGLTRYVLKRLPEMLERPSAVYESRSRGNVAVLDGKDPEGIQLVAPFLTGTRDRSSDSWGTVNFVLSIYGATNLIKNLVSAAKAGRLLYVDKGRVSKLVGAEVAEGLDVKRIARIEPDRLPNSSLHRQKPVLTLCHDFRGNDEARGVDRQDRC